MNDSVGTFLDERLSLMYLSPPLRVPTLGRLAAYTASRPRTIFARGGPSLIVHLDDALLRFPVAITLLSAGGPQPTSGDAADDVAHDAFFHVARVDDEPCAVFVRAVLTARRMLLTDVETLPAVDADVADIDHAMADVCRRLFGRGAPVAERRASAMFPSAGAGGMNPLTVVPDGIALRRWIRGHQIFAVLTQSLIVGFHALAASLRSDDMPAVRDHADLCLSLFRGSGAALQFTGAFSADGYNALVRPLMMPPEAPVALSGLMSVDHRVLVRTMRDMKPAFLALRDRDPVRYERLHDELSAVYDRHIHVCERFVGTQQSLLTAGRTEKSGPDLIRHFRTLRLKPLERDARVEPLESDARPVQYLAADRPPRRRPGAARSAREDGTDEVASS